MGLPSAKPVELVRDVEVKSPCNGTCTLDLFDVCRGCLRTREDISKWYVMSNEEKLAVKRNILTIMQDNGQYIDQIILWWLGLGALV